MTAPKVLISDALSPAAVQIFKDRGIDVTFDPTQVGARSAALQVTLDSITQGLVKIDTEGRVSVYNRRFLELLDLPDEMMRERPLHDDVVVYQARRGDFGPEFNWVEPRARSYVALDPRADLPEQYWRRTRPVPV